MLHPITSRHARKYLGIKFRTLSSFICTSGSSFLGTRSILFINNIREKKKSWCTQWCRTDRQFNVVHALKYDAAEYWYYSKRIRKTLKLRWTIFKLFNFSTPNTAHAPTGSVAFFSHAFSTSSKYGARIFLHVAW